MHGAVHEFEEFVMRVGICILLSWALAIGLFVWDYWKRRKK